MDFVRIQEFAHRNGHTNSRPFVTTTFGDQIALAHLDLSLTLEEYRNGARPEPELLYSKDGHPFGIPFALASAFIRLAAISKEFGLPVSQALTQLVQTNPGDRLEQIGPASHQWLTDRLHLAGPPTFPELIAAAHLPLADALRTSRQRNSQLTANKLAKAIIWVLGIAWHYGIDLTPAVIARLIRYQARDLGLAGPPPG